MIQKQFWAPASTFSLARQSRHTGHEGSRNASSARLDLNHAALCGVAPTCCRLWASLVIVRSIVLVVFLSAVSAVTPSASATTPGAGARCRITAHRGNTGVPQTTATENGLTAYHRAVAARADYLETDVSATSNDYPMLMHDATVDRTTNGTGTLRSRPPPRSARCG